MRRSPTSPFFIKKTICLMQNKPHFMKRGHLWGEGEKQLKRKKCSTRGNYESLFFSYGKYLHVYFKPNINVNILNKQKHTRATIEYCFFYVE